MKLLNALKEVKKLKNIGGEKAIAIAALDELQEYSNNLEKNGYSAAQKKLTNRKRVLLGIAFSEFFANDNTDDSLFVASEKAGVLRKAIEVDENLFFDELYNLI